MPRIMVGPIIEMHFASLNEMIGELAEALDGGLLFVPTSLALEPGAERELLIHVPWLGRQLRVRGKVLRLSRGHEEPGLHIRLSDGAHDTLAHLREIMGKVKGGAMLEPDAGETSPEERVRSMAPTLRAMLASRAGPEERQVLARDVDPKVIEFLLKNPALTIDEVRRLAGRLTLNHQHFQQILRNPAWTADEMLRLTLARNPRLPEFLAEPLLQQLSVPILKSLAESQNVTASTRRVVVRLLAARGIVVSKRGGI